MSIDENTCDYTRLTKFKDGYHSGFYGVKCHDYPEEIFVVSGRLYDEVFNMWLETGHYASRPPYEKHGAFMDGDVIILEISYPSQQII